jgi:hypothetical protein
MWERDLCFFLSQALIKGEKLPMKRKRESEKTMSRLEELTSFVDHLSPAVRVGRGEPTAWTAVSLMTRHTCIEWIDRRRTWSDTIATLRKSVERYWTRIDCVQLAVNAGMVDKIDVTMEDGTIVTGSGGATRDGRHLSFVALLAVGDRGLPVALTQQIYAGNLDGVKRVINEGVDINAREGARDQDTALGMALSSITLNTFGPYILEHILRQPNIDIEDPDCDGNTVLHRFIRDIWPRHLAAFLRHNVNVHAQNKCGRTALHELVRSPSYGDHDGEKIRLLLQHGSGTLTLCADRQGYLPFGIYRPWTDPSWGACVRDANALKQTTIRRLTKIVSSFVRVPDLATIVMRYYYTILCPFTSDKA